MGTPYTGGAAGAPNAGGIAPTGCTGKFEYGELDPSRAWSSYNDGGDCAMVSMQSRGALCLFYCAMRICTEDAHWQGNTRKSHFEIISLAGCCLLLLLLHVFFM